MSRRLAFISTMAGAPWGGSEELWSRAAVQLRAAGHSVAASVTGWPELSPRVTGLAQQGVELFVRPPEANSLRARLRNKARHPFRPAGDRGQEWLRRFAPDLVVISQGGNGDGLEWMRFCRDTGTPYVVIMHCNHEGWWPADDLARELAGAYGAARRIFGVSQHNLKLLESQLGTALPQSEVLWNPINVPPGPPPDWPPDHDVCKWACVGRLEPAAKGQDLLCEVLARPEWRERPVELNLYGAGPCERTLKQLAARWQLANVKFRGHQPDVKKIWAENHLLVMPSRYEGLPLALVEAMWCARPVVVTDIGGNAEMCLDGQTGFVAAAPAAGLLAETLERAWQQRAHWPELGRAARRRAEEILPRDAVADFCVRLLALARAG